jgi:hypothetical protein
VFTDYPVYVAGGLALVAALAAGRFVPTTRTVSLRRSVAALRGWHVADLVRLADGTLDHVVVAPAALLAVTATTHAPGPADLAAAERAAQQVRELARHAGVPDAVVVPVVQVSDPAGASDGHRVVHGVHVVGDAASHAWLKQFREARIAAAPRIALARALDRRAETPQRTRRRVEALIAPPEPAGA